MHSKRAPATVLPSAGRLDAFGRPSHTAAHHFFGDMLFGGVAAAHRQEP
ncbi:hypothetical protein [Deinococcus ruber]|nr:hypothetical protein [Deinococcus ruber]